jgi:hypothetical protein
LHPFRADTAAFFGAIVIACLASYGLVVALRLEDSLLGAISIFVSVLLAGGVTSLLTMRPQERRLASALLARMRPA